MSKLTSDTAYTYKYVLYFWNLPTSSLLADDIIFHIRYLSILLYVSFGREKSRDRDPVDRFSHSIRMPLSNPRLMYVPTAFG